MASAVRGGIFARKSVESLVRQTEGERTELRRAVGVADLTALGLGAIIGAAIFVIIGEAIGDAGPSIILSFVLAGITCAFSALAFAELASMIPVSGSAYTYTYATLGELMAWIIGWDLILEYSVTVAAVSVGWGGYLNVLAGEVLGSELPAAISAPRAEGGIVNLPAVFVVLAVTTVLVLGVKQSARTNTVMVLVKIAVLTLFVVLGVTAISTANYSPFFTQGFSGTVTAASLIFFAYIGFDAVSTSSEEVKDPSRTLPRAIIGSLIIATFLYIAVAVVATGLLPAGELEGSEAPLGEALSKGAGFGFTGTVIAVGALIAITSVVLTFLYGQTRIMFSMCRDGLLPRSFGKISARTRTPVRITVTFGVAIALLAAFLPLTELAKLVNVGTLFAFILVNLGVIVLRRTTPDAPRGYRVPFVPVFPVIGCLLCLLLLFFLEEPVTTLIRFAVWLAIGLLIYFLYGRTHSMLRQGETGAPELEVS